MTTEPAAVTAPAHAPVSTPRAYIQLLITITIWGGYFVVAKKAVGEASPLALSTGRYVIGGVALLLLAMRMGPFPRPSRRDLYVLAAMGATSVFGFNILSFIGLDLAPASDAALLMPTTPSLFVLPMAMVLFGEHFGRRQAGGLALLLAGEFFVFRHALFSEDISGERLAGIGCFVGSAFLWAVYTICARFLGGRLSPVHATLYGVAFGLALLLPFGAWPLGQSLASPSGGLVAALFYLGILQTVIGLVWWFEGIQAIGAARAAVINTLVPVVALVFAALFLDEVPGAERLFGAALVISGVAFASTRREVQR